MRSKLKRINRGVVLTILTAIVFIIGITISNQSFKKREADEIRSVIRNYVEQMALCSVNSESADDFAEKSSAEARKIIASYWEDSKYLENYNNSFYSDTYYTLKSDIVTDISYAGDFMNSTGYVSAVNCTVSVGKLRKVSAYGAEANLSVTYKISGKGDSGFYTLGGIYPVYGLSEDTPVTREVQYATIELYKEADQWKIVGLDWWGLEGDDMNEYY